MCSHLHKLSLKLKCKDCANVGVSKWETFYIHFAQIGTEKGNRDLSNLCFLITPDLCLNIKKLHWEMAVLLM